MDLPIPFRPPRAGALSLAPISWRKKNQQKVVHACSNASISFPISGCMAVAGQVVMAMAPEGRDLQLPALPLDQPVSLTVLGHRRNGVSFSSSTTYLTVPRYERRGGISYERADKNAIYVRALGDGRIQGKGKSLIGEMDPLFEWERNLIEKLNLPECGMRFRSRFMSMQRVHRRRQSKLHRTQKNKQNIDESYHNPAQLLLTRVGCWDFDVFHLDTLTGGRPLLHLAYHIFREYGFIQSFQLDVIKLLRFFSSIEDHYHDSNPYHDVIHATDVMQAMYCYLQEEKLQRCVTPLEGMVAILSAMSHDLDHPGVNQTFLVATANHLATLYQNTSVLEMHHWRCGVGLMQECDLFPHFSNSHWARFIWQFRSLILATDITRQQEFLLKFRRMIDEKQCDFETSAQTRHFVLQIALKCADICNPCRKWSLSERWSRQICEEFFRQGDLERQVGIPVTPVCDRRLNTVAKIQIGFMEVVVKPLFVEWKRFLPTDMSTKMLANIQLNKEKWQDIEEADSLARSAGRQGTESSSSSVPSPDSQTSRRDLNSNSVSGSQEERICVLEEEGGDERTDVSDRGEGEDEEDDDDEEEEEEEHGEEADIVENDVNLAFHYQTDSEQLSESGGLFLPPPCEEEQLRFLAVNSRRRHSMPVVVRKDLGFYMGLRRDSRTCYSFLRRQSLPARSIMTSWPESRTEEEEGDCVMKDVSVEGLRSRPKISNLSSAMNPRLDSLTFLPLHIQTQRLQQGSEAESAIATAITANINTTATSTTTKTFSAPHPPWQSSSCMEFRRRSHVLKEDSERLKSALSRVVTGARLCHQELVGLASSWPSVLRAERKVDEDELKLLAEHVGLPSPPESSTNSESSSPSSSGSNSSDSIQVHRSPPPTRHLLSRPH